MQSVAACQQQGCRRWAGLDSGLQLQPSVCLLQQGIPAPDAAFRGIKKSWHNLAHGGSELDGIHCKVRHGVFISARFVVACGKFEMRLGSVELLVGAFSFVAHPLLQWNLSTPKPSAAVTELCTHLLKQRGVNLMVK